jgi:hypothetical protein
MMVTVKSHTASVCSLVKQEISGSRSRWQAELSFPHAGLLLESLFNPEGGNDMSL